MTLSLKNKNLQFFICFGGILLADALLSHFQLESWRYLTKPLIVGALILYFLQFKSKLSKKIFQFGLAALLLSLMGDILLMFSSQASIFFIAGLAAFLVAHIFYILLFLKQRNTQLQLPWLKLINLLFYAFLMGYLVIDNTGDLTAAVLLYIVVITGMAFTAQLRKGAVVTISYGLGLVGARLFLASDSLLALSMFREGFPEVGFLVMITYGMAQAFIVYSLVRSEDKILSKYSL